MQSKICKKCNENKPLEDFHRQKGGKYDRRSSCKICCNKQVREIYHRDIEKSREKARKSGKKHYKNNSEKLKEKASKYRKIKFKDPEWRDKKRKLDREYYHRKKEDINWLKKERARLAKWKRDNREYERSRWAAYNAAKLKRTPKWADLEAIKEFYKNCPKGYEVDHVYPLQGEICSGLHVLDNLQYLTRSENARKNNKMPEDWRVE